MSWSSTPQSDFRAHYYAGVFFLSITNRVSFLQIGSRELQWGGLLCSSKKQAHNVDSSGADFFFLQCKFLYLKGNRMFFFFFSWTKSWPSFITHPWIRAVTLIISGTMEHTALGSHGLRVEMTISHRSETCEKSPPHAIKVGLSVSKASSISPVWNAHRHGARSWRVLLLSRVMSSNTEIWEWIIPDSPYFCPEYLFKSIELTLSVYW